MQRPLALFFLLLAAGLSAQAQSRAHFDRVSGAESSNSQSASARALSALERLNEDVFVYRSLGEFEENRKLARVSYQVFNEHLQQAAAEVEAALPRLSDNRLKLEITNALASYRDGAYWWQKVSESRVIHVSEFRSSSQEMTATDSFFAANIPYTVAIHWRQANRYLQRAIRDAERS
jgi:chaperonin cofactor prefoldin